MFCSRRILIGSEDGRCSRLLHSSYLSHNCRTQNTVSSLQLRMKTLTFLVVVGTYSTAAGKQDQSVYLMALIPRCFQSFHVYFQKTLRRAHRRNGIDRCGSWYPVHTRDASLLISTRSLLLFLLSL